MQVGDRVKKVSGEGKGKNGTVIQVFRSSWLGDKAIVKPDEGTRYWIKQSAKNYVLCSEPSDSCKSVVKTETKSGFVSNEIKVGDRVQKVSGEGKGKNGTVIQVFRSSWLGDKAIVKPDEGTRYWIKQSAKNYNIICSASYRNEKPQINTAIDSSCISNATISVDRTIDNHHVANCHQFKKGMIVQKIKYIPKKLNIPIFGEVTDDEDDYGRITVKMINGTKVWKNTPKSNYNITNLNINEIHDLTHPKSISLSEKVSELLFIFKKPSVRNVTDNNNPNNNNNIPNTTIDTSETIITKTPPKPPRNNKLIDKEKTNNNGVSPSIDTSTIDLEIQDKVIKKDIFLKGNKLVIISWNTLKMNIINSSNIRLRDEFICGLAGENPDILVLQEIKSGLAGKKRVTTFMQLLEHSLQANGEDEYKFDPIFSTTRSSNDHKEIHAMLIRRRKGLVIKHHDTFDFDGKIEYSPLSVHLVYTPFETASQHLCITSVHLPPKTRTLHRNQCFNTLFSGGTMSGYIQHIKSAFQGTGNDSIPFNTREAKDVKQKVATHIICGDFNCCPDFSDNNNKGQHEWKCLGK